MISFDITSLSSKGQVVIPSQLRKVLGIKNGTKFVVFTDGSNLLLKPISKPRVESFKKLVAISREFVKKKNLKPSDLDNIIKEVRDENSS